jgi:hypothetical protein
MGSNFRTYIAECFKQAPQSWRKGAVVMTAIITVALFLALLIGWRLDAYPTAWFLVGTGAIAAFDVLVVLPYQLWKANRAEIGTLRGILGRRTELAEIGKLRRKLVVLRVEMTRDQEGNKTEEGWDREFGAVAAEITEKIRGFAGDAEADIYDARGNITRRFGPGLPPHQRVIDIIVHDLDRLREFIKDYSRGKDRTV